MQRKIGKVYAYIVHGNRLLIFTQPRYPNVIPQVPGGTLEAGEQPDKAVLREAFEETGLDGLAIVEKLGEAEVDYSADVMLYCHFYQLRCTQQPPEKWEHVEMFAAEGDENPLFAFEWIAIDESMPDLGIRGLYLPELKQKFAV